MQLGPNDLHITFDADSKLLKVWKPNGTLLWQTEARNRTVADGQLYHYGNCPPGEFLLGAPVGKNTAPFGPFFIPVLDYAGHHAMLDFQRSGIGIHGGGSGLPVPLADYQGWCPTHGCIRCQNAPLRHLVALVKASQVKGGRVFFTVTGTAP